MSVVIRTGNDYAIKYTATLDDATFSINTGATVTALISSLDGSTILTPAVACLSTASGADWSNSLVVISFTAAQTAAITVYTHALLQLQIDDSGKSSWSSVIKIERGNL